MLYDQASLQGAKYILDCIGDLSRFTWVYFPKNEGHSFEKCMKFRTFVEKKCGQPIKCLKLDNGGEYVS